MLCTVGLVHVAHDSLLLILAPDLLLLILNTPLSRLLLPSPKSAGCNQSIGKSSSSRC